MKDILLKGHNSVTLLVLANAISVGGDVLLAFIWNARLIVSNPVLALGTLGAVSLVGVIGSILVGPWIVRIRNQAMYLAVGSTLRLVAVGSLGLVTLINEQLLLPLAATVQITDTVVTTLTAGAVMTLISAKVPKERFVQVMALNQSATRIAVLTAWLLGGVLLTYLRLPGMLLLDVLSFVPITLLLFGWARESKNVTLFKTGSQPPKETIGLISWKQVAATIFPYALVFLLGSLVSRTTPLLWRQAFPASPLPFDLMQGLLFGVFMGGYLGSSLLLATKYGSTKMQHGVSRGRALPILTLVLGASIALLPWCGLSPIIFIDNLLLMGLLSGLVPTALSGKVRHDLEGAPLRAAFYYMGLVGRFSEPIGSGIAGAILSISHVGGLYLISGFGIVLTAGLMAFTASIRASGVPREGFGS